VVMLLDNMRTGLLLPAGQSGRLRLVHFPRTALIISRMLSFFALLVVASAFVFAKDAARNMDLWSLKPLVRPEIPRGVCSSTNPIDAVIGYACRDKVLAPLDPAAKLTWLRRVTFDLSGLPPSVVEQEDFLW